MDFLGKTNDAIVSLSLKSPYTSPAVSGTFTQMQDPDANHTMTDVWLLHLSLITLWAFVLLFGTETWICLKNQAENKAGII